MQYGNIYVLGYWPSFLFSDLTESASMIEWGGEVVNSQSYGQYNSTQMDSGRFSKASYLKNIQVHVRSNVLLRFLLFIFYFF